LQWSATEFRTLQRSDDVVVPTNVEGVRLKRVTLNVELAEVGDLLESVPRACLAFIGDEGPEVEPVTVAFEGGRYFVGAATRAASRLAGGEEVVLVIDDGVQFFDLRAIYVRGHVEPLDESEGTPNDFSWFEVSPIRTVAWDYARIREVDHES
jgi:hypothetical protein